MTEEQAIKVAEQWLSESADSAMQYNLEKHMGMISKDVSVVGVPGFESINYDTWYNQCKHQFENAMLKNIAYKGLNLLSAAENQLVFTVLEKVVATDGALNEQIIEMCLEKEADGAWRLIKERVLIENDAMRNHEIAKD